jgi:hypothetical protein
MSYYTTSDAYGQAGDWLIGTAKRNPEALLVLAAGCALLMRGGRSASSQSSYTNRFNEQRDGGERGPSGRLAEGVSRVAESASEYASDIKDRVSDTASSYASTASDYAADLTRNVSAQTARLTDQAQSTIQIGYGHVMREQPLAVALLGLAAGAALAAVFPSTKMEDQFLGPAHEAIAEVAGKIGDDLMEAASDAGERLKQGAAERGLSSEGVKELARDVAGTFTSKVSGKTADEAQGGGELR